MSSYDGLLFERFPARERTFYRELRPISQEFQLEALEVNGLDRPRLVAEGAVAAGCDECGRRLGALYQHGQSAVLVAYPVAFDWSFLYWYFKRFASGGSPFGHSPCLDIRTLYQASAGTVFDCSGKEAMPSFWLPESPHTHNALADAVEQGELFANLMGWAIRRRRQSTRAGESDRDAPSWLSSHVLPIA